jgi:biotin carboxylase
MDSSGRTRPAAGAGTVRCAVVDAYSTGRFLPAELRRRGAEVLHVRSTPQVPAHLRRVRWQSAAGETLVHRGDPQWLADRLRRRGVTHVLAGSECGVLLADRLSSLLGTPGQGTRCPAARRDKSLMAARVRAAGLAVPDGRVVRRPQQLLDWSTRHGRWPVVVKPVDSAGGDNVWICQDREEALTALGRVVAGRNMVGRPNRQALVQEYLVGDEVFVNTVSLAGHHHVAEVWRYVKRRLPDGPVVYDYEEPLPDDDPCLPSLVDHVRGVLDALEIRYWAAHTEVMLTDRGPVLVETGARLAGSVLPAAVRRCFGVSQVDLLAMAVTDPERFLAAARNGPRPGAHLRYVSLISPRGGVRIDPDGVERIRALPTFAELSMSAATGGRLPRTTDSASGPGQVYLLGRRDAVERDYQRIRQMERSGLYVD